MTKQEMIDRRRPEGVDVKKLWTVLYEAEIVVYAETRGEAYEIAERHRRDAELDHVRTYETGKCLPYGWEEDCTPYGEDELSIKDIWALPAVSADR